MQNIVNQRIIDKIGGDFLGVAYSTDFAGEGCLVLPQTEELSQNKNPR